MTDTTTNDALGKFIAAQAIAGAVPQKVEGTHQLIVPPNYTVKDLTDAVEKAQNGPNRKRGTVTLLDIPSLLVYLADQAAQTVAYVYADPDARTITAVFNDLKNPDYSGWRDNRAQFTAVFTPEFQNWLTKDKHVFTQTEFAEFLEDNMADLQGAEATNLLTVASTIQATTGINFASAKRLHDGQTQLIYNETIDAKAGANGDLSIPKTFDIGLRIFKNGGGYTLTARLKYRLHGGAVKFFYELERPERTVEDAFGGYIDTIRTHHVDVQVDADGAIVPNTGTPLGYTVLLGKA
jgi:uncharacterized protein YfdQ (DUF2303 family)